MQKQEVNPEVLEQMKETVAAISNCGLEVEICGSWIWVSGDTRTHKETLKSAGFRWAPVKKKWHWAAKRSFSRGNYSMEQIREHHGSFTV